MMNCWKKLKSSFLVADIGVDATKTIIANLTERTARGDLIYSHSLYKALQEELVALLAPRVKPLHIDPNKTSLCDFGGGCKRCG